MRSAAPDFFVHSGDQIYADVPLQEEVALDSGSDFTVRLDLQDLPAGEEIFYRVQFRSLLDAGTLSDRRVPGKFRLQPDG
jgi:phosphodiesterase/alkaline phosphatase D-like protein